MNKSKRLIFLSRHSPSYGQISMSRLLGYQGINRKSLIFPDTKGAMEKMVDKLKLRDSIVALTAPTWVHYVFWDKEYSTIEFVQDGKCRADPGLCGTHIVKGMWIFKPSNVGEIEASFINCQLSVDEQLDYAGLKK
jgi:hypothetical protein